MPAIAETSSGLNYNFDPFWFDLNEIKKRQKDEYSWAIIIFSDISEANFVDG